MGRKNNNARSAYKGLYHKPSKFFVTKVVLLGLTRKRGDMQPDYLIYTDGLGFAPKRHYGSFVTIIYNIADKRWRLICKRQKGWESVTAEYWAIRAGIDSIDAESRIDIYTDCPTAIERLYEEETNFRLLYDIGTCSFFCSGKVVRTCCIPRNTNVIQYYCHCLASLMNRYLHREVFFDSEKHLVPGWLKGLEIYLPDKVNTFSIAV